MSITIYRTVWGNQTNVTSAIHDTTQHFMTYNRHSRPYSKSHLPVIGAFAKLRKTTMSFVMSVMPVRLERLGSQWTDFH